MKSAFATLALAAFILPACGEEDVESSALYDQLEEANYQHNWTSNSPTGEPKDLSKNSSHGDQGIIYYNDVVKDALKKSGLSAWPIGSIFVIDGYQSGELYETSVIEKRNNGWFAAAYQDGYATVSSDDALELFTNCHGMYEENDYITSVALP